MWRDLILLSLSLWLTSSPPELFNRLRVRTRSAACLNLWNLWIDAHRGPDGRNDAGVFTYLSLLLFPPDGGQDSLASAVLIKTCEENRNELATLQGNLLRVQSYPGRGGQSFIIYLQLNQDLLSRMRSFTLLKQLDSTSIIRKSHPNSGREYFLLRQPFVRN